MQIVFLGTSGIDDASPRGRWLPIARELVRAGHRVDLALLHPTYDVLSPHRSTIEGVQVAHVGQMHVYGYPGHRRYFGPLKLLQVSLSGSLALARHTIGLRPDAIHIMKPQPINGLAGVLAARVLKRPFYIDCDDYEAAANRFSGAWQRRLVQWWEDHLPPKAQGVSVNTRFLYERCRQLGVVEQRIVYVPNGVDVARMPRVSDTMIHQLRDRLGLGDAPIIVYLGAMSTIAHGVDLLIDAFATVRHLLPQARLLMVGDGDDRVMLETHARTLGINDAIRWVGRVAPNETAVYLASAQCSVDPVHDSPGARARSPLKIVESLAQGVPVVTSDVGDRSEMLGGGSAGLLVSPGNAQALALALLRVLTEPELRARLASGARERAAAYEWRRLMHPWLSMYA